MNRILRKEELAPQVKLFEVEAPLIVEKARAGQFVVIRIDEKGERIPLTIADKDPERGTLILVVQEVGKTTHQMGMLEQGYEFADVIGPLGKPSHVENFGTVVCVGGGIGIAPVYPIAKAMKEAGNKVISIIGARSKELLVFEDEMGEVSDKLHITTDDGSYGRHGFVTDELTALLESGSKMDLVVAIGPAIMMKMVSEVTQPYGVRTIVSLNSIMVDATGMCGACRVEVGGETRFVCVDGPEFDAHQVDFDQLIARQSIYLPEEKKALNSFKARLNPNSPQNNTGSH